jgi:carbamoyl-phosphate synthase large subunit
LETILKKSGELMKMASRSNTDCNSKDINILILSAGRRVELLQCFKRAAQRINISSRIVAADMNNLAPALYFSDKYFIVPRIDHKDYINKIIEICIEENISLIVPTIDTELLLLSKNKKFIEEQTNAKVLISDDKVINICRNKINTQKFFEDNNFLVPRQINKDDIETGEVDFPVFIKPVDGSSSINAFKVNNIKELKFFMEYIDKPIIQEMIVGEEYTVDVFLDFECNLISAVPRLRIATRSGEILKGRIRKDQDIISDIKRLMGILKPIGHITVQCMKTNRGIEYIEINPRFGGGAPMSISAGADSCEYLYRLLNGDTVPYAEDYKDNVTFLRFDKSIMLDETNNYVPGVTE